MKSTPQVLTFGLVLSLALVWGSSFMLMERGLLAFSPLQVAALRIVIAGLVLLPFLLTSLRKVKKEAWPYILLVGLIGNAIPAFLFPLAETVITPGSAGILNTLSPVFALVVGVLLFGFQFSSRKVWGILISFAGALILVLAGAQEIDLLTHLAYSGLVVLATLGYGFSVNLIKKYLQEVSALHISTLALLAMAMPYGLYLLFGTDVGQILTEHPQGWSSLGYIAILAALGTSIALILFNRLVQLTDPVISASVTYLIPMVAVGWDLVAGISLFPGQWLGMGIVLLGVWLVNKG